MWTEIVSADALVSSGREILLNDLKFSESERPIVAQLFTGHPEKMRQAAALVQSLGFDGLDINMGCPDRTVEKQHAGAALLKDLLRAKEIIRAARQGAPRLPISVKTRTGYNKNEIDTLIPALLEEGVAAIIIHTRTRKEMSSVPARWEAVERAVALRDSFGGRARAKTLIIGNGDVKGLAEAREKAERYGCDGVMLGRAIFGNPFLFRNKNVLSESEGHYIPTIEEKLKVMVEHTKLFEEIFGQTKSFAVMKKHFKAYAGGFDGARELRMELMEAKSSTGVEAIVKNFLSSKV